MTPHCGHCAGHVRLWGKTRQYDDVYRCNDCGRLTLWTREGRLWSPFKRDEGAEVAE